MADVDNIEDVNTDSAQIIKKQMLHKAGIPNVAEIMYNELISSTSFFAHASQTVAYFIKFMKQ